MQVRLSLHTWRLAGNPDVAQLSKATKLIVKVPAKWEEQGRYKGKTGQPNRHTHQTLCLFSGEAIFEANSQHLFWMCQINTFVKKVTEVQQPLEQPMESTMLLQTIPSAQTVSSLAVCATEYSIG